MNGPVYYNELDPFAAAWLRALIDAGELPPGDVDTRSIADVRPDDLWGYRQCHFFAGIGGWPLAIRWAGLEAAESVWTGSCPCQPFSAAGKRTGTADERHLWPVFFDLIKACRPVVVFGEQVESAVGHGWLDGVFGDLEGEAYTCGAVVLGAHSVGAPHIRQRLYWVADASSSEWNRRDQSSCDDRKLLHAADGGRSCDRLAESESLQFVRTKKPGDGSCEVRNTGQDVSASVGRSRGAGRMGDSNGKRQGQVRGISCRPGTNDEGNAGRLEHAPRDGRQQGGPESDRRSVAGGCGDGCGMADTDSDGSTPGQSATTTNRHRSSVVANGCWSDFRLVDCRDGKSRRIESGTQPLAHGIPGRVGRLRGYGNAIVPQVAEEFIRAWLETRGL